MSAVDRLYLAANHLGAESTVRTDDVRTVLRDLDDADQRADHFTTRAGLAETRCAELYEERNAERTRADAAEAECARLTTERDAARAEAARLRAIVEGRTVPPSAAEIEAHAAAGGRWRVRLTHGGIYTARYPDAPILAHVGATWWAIDRDDWPCAWPTVPRSEGP